MEMEQWYWAGIDDSLADGIQFVENHAKLTESTEGFPERPAKKRARFSRVLDTQIRILVPHPPTSPARSSSPHPPVADSRSPYRLPPSPPPPPPIQVIKLSN